ncbi:MAG: RCC1 domain-containing protein [Gemmatimonadota bacterium]
MVLGLSLPGCSDSTGPDEPIGPEGPWLSVRVAKGGAFTCGLTAEREAFCWGGNADGQLGNGTREGSLSPGPVVGGLTFEQISPGIAHTCAVTPEGKAFCWGRNDRTGALGDGTTMDRLAPTPVAGGLSFRQISAGSAHTCALTPAGEAFCWGNDAHGQLGDGQSNGGPNPLPAPVAGGLTFQQISAGQFGTCGLTREGKAFCWGANHKGTLGDGTMTDRATPGPVAGGLSFARISAGLRHVCGVTPEGEAYCWGRNSLGALGDGAMVDRPVPTRVATELRFQQISAGEQSCALTREGQAFCWGDNSFGELGDGTTMHRLTPTPVAGGLSFHEISTGFSSSCGVTLDGEAFCWGARGLVGDGTNMDRLVPTRIPPPQTRQG